MPKSDGSPGVIPLPYEDHITRHMTTEVSMSLHPYLTFSGTTRQAMTRYHEIFGGRLDIMTFGDIPEGESLPPDIPDDLIMHASLFFGDGDRLMASDDPSCDGSGVTGVSLNITLHDQAEGRRIFEALADGGTVAMPLEATFWAPLFGVCVDRFGVSWMVNVEEEAGEPVGDTADTGVDR